MYFGGVDLTYYKGASLCRKCQYCDLGSASYLLHVTIVCLKHL
jgi:hypothetical protein